MAKKPKRKSGIITVKFSKDAAGFHIPDADYLFEIEEVEERTAENSGEPYLSIILRVAEGEFENKKIYHTISLQEQSLPYFKTLLDAIGVEVEVEEEVEINVNDLIGEQVGGSTYTETYQGKKRSRVSEFFSVADLEEGERPPKESKDRNTEKTTKEQKTGKKEKPKKSTFEVGMKVTFLDEDDEEVSGKITEIDEDEETATVKVGKKEWEIDFSDLTPE